MKQFENEILAILFAAGEPLERARLAEALHQDEETCIRMVDSLRSKMEEGDGPFLILDLDGRYQMTTRAEFAPVIRSALELRRNIPLSQAALEVLAIIAYNQPVTRAFIEQVRGVDSSSVVNSLVEKTLVEEAGRLELPGRPISYCTTPNFLRCFGLNSLEELPEVQSPEEDAPPGEQLNLDSGSDL